MSNRETRASTDSSTLKHVRDSLEQAVLRLIYDTPYDGENAVAAEDIARGAAQFAAAMY